VESWNLYDREEVASSVPAVTISPDEVRARVQNFWRVFSSKAKNEFSEQYLPSATVFTANTPRSEPARLMVERRARELFGPTSSVAAKLGTIAVQILGPTLAIASYPLEYSVTRERPNGRRYRLNVAFARATQIFVRDKDGVLRIIHEHMSSAEAVDPEELAEEPR
jgi:hypothetical protein